MLMSFFLQTITQAEENHCRASKNIFKGEQVEHFSSH